jgi:hypothetical protein
MLQLNCQTPQQSLNAEIIRFRPNESDFNRFKQALAKLLGQIDEADRENRQENYVRDFLLESFYRDRREINKKGDVDLAIHTGKTKDSNVAVIVEAKRPTGGEMISAANPNAKALQQAVLYFMRERVDENNIDLKYIVVTNIKQWFIFKAADFNRYFHDDAKFRRDYEEWRDKIKVAQKTKDFYAEIAKPALDKLENALVCTHFKLEDYAAADEKELIALYKIFSPFYLLKESLATDSNRLDRNFYTELLHIIGLEETKEKNKILIKRKAENKRDSGSLLEKAIDKIESKYSRFDQKKMLEMGADKDERVFNVALELCIVWTNRILFLKLLESQLVAYHENNAEFRFLNVGKINNFGELYVLFHDVLNKIVPDRSLHVAEKYSYIPYLNSSLFDFAEVEYLTIAIDELDNNIKLTLQSASILRKIGEDAAELPTLEYLFRFLDAYDFASEGKEGVQPENRSLINASVLGKVFEKINGYKDGSFYTPGFVTMYMCRQAIRAAVVQKFKERYELDVETFDDLYIFVSRFNRTEKTLEFNRVIDELKICDPAVGSGHFLVSALNEMLAIKSELGIFADAAGKPFNQYRIAVANDEIIVTDRDNKPFRYTMRGGRPLTVEMQRLQETLFHEKQTIIENCLFGVDINPNSVKICRLRLWIELLKNAYYKQTSEPGAVATGLNADKKPVATAPGSDLETLPNIDINIKQGNSLVSRYKLDEDLSQALKSKTVKYTVEDYRRFVQSYRETRDREAKKEFLEKIEAIKNNFQTEIFKKHPKMVDLDKKYRRLNEINHPKLFDKYSEGQREVLSERLHIEIAKIEQEIEDIKNNVLYRNAFEWRFEFPEVLNDDGDFTGFDVVVGNPPYIPLESFDNNYRIFFKKKYEQIGRKYDSSVLFIIEGLKLLKDDGVISYIAPITWQTGENYSKLREFFIENYGIDFIINLPFNTFENAYVETSIYNFIKGKLSSYRIFNFDKKDSNESLNKVSFTSIPYSKIKAPNYKIILDLSANAELEKYSNDNFIPLGLITKSTQGLSASRFSETQNTGEYIYPILKKGNVYNYNLVIEETYNTDLSDKKSLIQFYEAEAKVLIRRIVNRQDRLSVGFTNKQLVFKKDINPFIPTDKNYSAKFLLGVLASKHISHLYINTSTIATKDDFRQTTLAELRNLPIPKISLEKQQQIIIIVDRILELKKQGGDTSGLEAEIDRMVFDLYELTADERRIVSGL